MDKKVVLITAAGAGNAVGYGIAETFASAGYNLIITARNKGRLKEAARNLSALYNVEIMTHALDVTEPSMESSVAELVHQIENRFGRLDVLVNASQAAKIGDLLQNTKLADFELSLRSGLIPALLLMKACYGLLKEARGVVINCTSAGTASGQAGMSVLAASKEGLRGVSRVVANEWLEDGIAVRCMNPVVKTAAYEKWQKEYPQTAENFAEPESIKDFGMRCLLYVEKHQLQKEE